MISLHSTQIHFDDQVYELYPNQRNGFDEFYTDYRSQSVPKGHRYQLILHVKRDILLKDLILRFERNYQMSDRLLANGFQSWSESREYAIDEAIPTLRWPVHSKRKYFGDDYIKGITRGKGHIHSWTYSYIRRKDRYLLIGSLTERNGFSLIHHDVANGQLLVRKDCNGQTLSHSFPILDLVILEGGEQAVFDAYFELMECPPRVAKPMKGWTSWYNYYTQISEKIIVDTLQAFKEKEAPIDIIQIDDGYQTKVGDWLSIKPEFSGGMGNLARKIQQAGYKAGLWLAPFVCAKDSKLAQQHPNWLLKDERGKAIQVSHIPLWKGWFYALDFYQPAVQNYLTGVFHQVLDRWGYDFVKLDFLFAVCIHPKGPKNRGQIMHEAMSFLRNLVGDKLMLACGVPLGSAFGLADYCRIGGDIHLKWVNSWDRFMRIRERVSTLASLRSTIGRRQLNGRAFLNDPDVFILREENNSLHPNQQYSLLLLNTLLGDLLFSSDEVGKYQEEQWAEWESVVQWADSKVLKLAHLGTDQYRIDFKWKNKRYQAIINLSAKEMEWQSKGRVLHLEAFESLVLKA
ncbi:MAG: glycoside hydrolase family 36 protein [Bacteroidota bacterium]